MNRHNPKAQQKLVDEWNSRHPSGTSVTRYRLVKPLREPEETKTRSEAWLMGRHTAMVMVEGVSGGVMVESLNPTRPRDAQTAHLGRGAESPEL